jgi:hypothetical protein
MNLKEIEDFVQENRNTIKDFFEKNPKENLYTILMELTDKNLDLISKYKIEYEQSVENKVELEKMIKDLMKCVVDSLSEVPSTLSDNHYFRE